jgi:hypothetical protein
MSAGDREVSLHTAELAPEHTSVSGDTNFFQPVSVPDTSDLAPEYTKVCSDVNLFRKLVSVCASSSPQEDILHNLSTHPDFLASPSQVTFPEARSPAFNETLGISSSIYLNPVHMLADKVWTLIKFGTSSACTSIGCANGPFVTVIKQNVESKGKRALLNLCYSLY